MTDYKDRDCPLCDVTVPGDKKNCPECGNQVGRGGSYKGHVKIGGRWFKPAGQG